MKKYFFAYISMLTFFSCGENAGRNNEADTAAQKNNSFNTEMNGTTTAPSNADTLMKNDTATHHVPDSLKH